MSTQTIESPWRTDDPPKDGSMIVALGNVTHTDEDGAVEVEPFTESIRWHAEHELWLNGWGLAVEGYYGGVLTIHHWLPQPD